MQAVVAMSKIATLNYKKNTISVFIREKLGKHGAPYIVIELPDATEAHITLKDKKVHDSSITKADILTFVKKWIDAYAVELEASWNAARTGKALPVPSEMPRKEKPKKKKTESALRVCKIKQIRTTPQLHMVIQFDTGESRFVDFKKDVIPTNSSFGVLKDPKVFMLAKAHKSSVVWEEADIDIEATDLYDASTPIAESEFSNKIASHYA